MGLILWLTPIIAVFIFGNITKQRTFHVTSVVVSTVFLASTILLTSDVLNYGIVNYKFWGGIFYVDSLSIIILDIVLVIGFLVSIYSVGYLDEEIKHGKMDLVRLKIYYVLMYIFMFTMIIALTVNNMGIMWIAIESTTLASVFLVGFFNDKSGIEAAWKYVIICSVGIAIAFLGIIFIHLSSVGIIPDSKLLDWVTLYNNAEALKSPILRLAFIFILVGFGTKAGLAPMHTWLPDAHSQSPSPISALLSGVLLNSAMYAIIRAVAIVNKNLASSVFSGRLLIVLGLLSISTAAIFIITQKDYKRLLAYSSIEHMGVIALGIGIFTPMSVFGALFHMINHSFTKSMLFLSSGNILQKYNTKDIAKVNNLLKIMPYTGTAFFLGIFAIAGVPPFSVFASEFSIIAAVFEKDLFLVGVIIIALLAMVFVGMALTLFKIFYAGDYETNATPGEINKAGIVVIIFILVIISFTGFYMPMELKTLIINAQKIIIGG